MNPYNFLSRWNTQFSLNFRDKGLILPIRPFNVAEIIHVIGGIHSIQVHFDIYLTIYLSIYLYINLSDYLSNLCIWEDSFNTGSIIYLSFYLSLYLDNTCNWEDSFNTGSIIYLSISISIYISVFLFLSNYLNI